MSGPCIRNDYLPELIRYIIPAVIFKFEAINKTLFLKISIRLLNSVEKKALKTKIKFEHTIYFLQVLKFYEKGKKNS